MRLPLPTDNWVRALLAPALVFCATAMDRNYQTDLWYHLACGRVAVHEGAAADIDRFSCTIAGQPFENVTWGWQTSFYRLHELGGLPLLQTVNSMTLAVMAALLVALAWRRSGSLPAAMALGLFTFFGLWQLLIIRSQTFSLLLFVALYWTLEEARRWPALLLLPPLFLAVWVNIHGGFPVALALIGCYALASIFDREDAASSAPFRWSEVILSAMRRGWPWALCLTASALAALVNPYGWHIYEYIGLNYGRSAGRRIDEWLPPGMGQLTGKVLALSVLLLIVLLARSAQRLTWRELFLIGCFLPPALGAVRMTAWWLIVVAPILATQAAALWPRLRESNGADRPTPAAALLCTGMLAAMVLSLPWLERYNPVLSRPGRAHRTETDLDAMAHRLAAERSGARLFTRFAWAGYFTWALDGGCTVFMDARIEIYPDPIWEQYTAVVHGRADWQDILNVHGIDALVLDDASGYHAELLPFVRASANWYEVGREGDAVLFVRKLTSGEH
jgi:hypothetical protein